MYSNLQILKNLITSTPQKHRLKEVIRTRRLFQGLCDLGGRLGRWEMMLHQKPTSHFLLPKVTGGKVRSSLSDGTNFIFSHVTSGLNKE